MKDDIFVHIQGEMAFKSSGHFLSLLLLSIQIKKPLKIVPQHTGNCSSVPGGRLVQETLKEKLGRKENWKTALKLTPEDSHMLM